MRKIIVGDIVRIGHLSGAWKVTKSENGRIDVISQQGIPWHSSCETADVIEILDAEEK